MLVTPGLLAIAAALVALCADPPVRVATGRAFYLEDDAGNRPVADVRATLWRDRTGVRLGVRIAALAPGIDPAFGADGVVGANVVTARELALLAASGELAFELRGPASGEVRVHQGIARRAPVPLRRFDRERARFAMTPTPEDLPVAWQATTTVLPPGRHTLVAVARGVPRLNVDVTVGPTSNVDGITSLGATLPAAAPVTEVIR